MSRKYRYFLRPLPKWQRQFRPLSAIPKRQNFRVRIWPGRLKRCPPLLSLKNASARGLTLISTRSRSPKTTRSVKLSQVRPSCSMTASAFIFLMVAVVATSFRWASTAKAHRMKSARKTSKAVLQSLPGKMSPPCSFFPMQRCLPGPNSMSYSKPLSNRPLIWETALSSWTCWKKTMRQPRKNTKNSATMSALTTWPMAHPTHRTSRPGCLKRSSTAALLKSSTSMAARRAWIN